MATPTIRQLAAYQRRSLRSMQSKLQEMSAAWDGVDQFNLGELDDLAKRCAEIAETLTESAEVEGSQL